MASGRQRAVVHYHKPGLGNTVCGSDSASDASSARDHPDDAVRRADIARETWTDTCPVIVRIRRRDGETK